MSDFRPTIQAILFAAPIAQFEPPVGKELAMTEHAESDLVARAIELLNGPPYLNVATATSDGQPWNTPVWAARDKDLSIYWSSWVKAIQSTNIVENPRVFLTLFDSTRKRGTNNLRCLYLQCTAAVVADPIEAKEAGALLYPGAA